MRPAGTDWRSVSILGLGLVVAGCSANERPSAPPLPDERKPAKARQVAGVIATIKPQAQALATRVGTNRTLVASYNLAPHCVPVKQPGKPASSEPSRALVVWSDTVCNNAKALDALRRQRPEGVLSGDPRFARTELHRYVTSAAPQLSTIEQGLASVPPTGIRGADDYRANLLSAIRRALPELRKRDPSVDPHTLPAADRVASVLATIKPDVRDLASIAARNPRLTPSYNLAPNCDPA